MLQCFLEIAATQMVKQTVILWKPKVHHRVHESAGQRTASWGRWIHSTPSYL